MKVAYINISRSTVPGPDDLPELQKHTMLYKQELSKMAEVHYLLRNSIEFDGIVSGVTVKARDFSVLRFLFFAVRYSAAHNIKVIIIHSLSHFMYVPFLRMGSGLKVVMQHHGELLFLHKKAFLMRFTDPFVDAYFFHGRGNALPFVNKKCISLSKVREIPEGTSDFKFVPVVNQGVHRLIFIGRLDKNKNLITLLKALSVLKDLQFVLNVYFGGDGMLTELQDFCAVNDLNGKVNFIGKVPASEIEKALQQSDIFISCSRYEGSGYSLIEALACGIFPVVSRIPPSEYLLNGLPHSRQFSPDNEHELRSCLQEVMNLRVNTDTRNAIRLFYEKNVSPPAVAETILRVITEL